MSSKKNTEVQKVMVLTTQRSGSNLLGTLLKSHPQVMYYGEVMKDKPKDSTFHFNYHFVRRTRILNKLLWKLGFKRAVVNIYWKYIDSLVGPTGKIVVVKPMVNQLKKYPELQHLPKNILIIRLVRENLLQKYISSVLAWKTKQWVQREDEDKSTTKLAIDCSKLINELHELKQANEFVETFSPESKSIRITYDQLVNSKDETLKSVLQFLNIDNHLDLSTSLRKQNANTLQDIVLNYEEVVGRLTGTEYEKMIY